jgi:hypothetical protein
MLNLVQGARSLIMLNPVQWLARCLGSITSHWLTLNGDAQSGRMARSLNMLNQFLWLARFTCSITYLGSL